MSHFALDSSEKQPSRALMAEHPEPPRVVRLVHNTLEIVQIEISAIGE